MRPILGNYRKIVWGREQLALNKSGYIRACSLESTYAAVDATVDAPAATDRRYTPKCFIHFS